MKRIDVNYIKKKSFTNSREIGIKLKIFFGNYTVMLLSN